MEVAVTLIGPTGRSYRVDENVLARGGQGSVWSGLRDDGLPVAIKVAAPTAVSIASIEHEGQLLAFLAEHRVPGVATLLDRVVWEGRPALVMPRYPEDASAYVGRLIRQHPGTAIEAILGFAAQVLGALRSLHRTQVPLPDGRVGRMVHRDVKPENILVDGEGGVRFVDFGGSLVVDAFQAVRLAVFGSPLWAPYDQVLPGLPEPNPTWDTYAACVVLFAWLTGSRPAYQADPSPVLTERGRAIWRALCAVASLSGEDMDALRAAHAALQQVREGTREQDLVEVRGHAAIQAEDVEMLRQGVGRLSSPGIYGQEALDLCVRDLGVLLGRGLSPLSHPSPPNRYWDAQALADEIDAVRRRLVQAREARAAEAARAGLERRMAAIEHRLLPATAVPIRTLDTDASDDGGLDPVPRGLRRAQPARRATSVAGWGGAALGLAVGLGLFGLLSIPVAVGLYRRLHAPNSEPVEFEAAAFPLGDPASGETRTVMVAAFALDRTEVSNADWKACMEASACAPLAWMRPDSPYHLQTGPKGRPFQGLSGDAQPVVGVTWHEAAGYCAARGGRLPTEEEWERAATWVLAEGGGQKRRWPWGAEEPGCDQANGGLCGRNTTLRVHDLEAGASPDGLLHLVGNAAEWTSTAWNEEVTHGGGLFRPREVEVRQRFVVRGGAWDDGLDALSPTHRVAYPPETVDPGIGFRCAYDRD